MRLLLTILSLSILSFSCNPSVHNKSQKERFEEDESTVADDNKPTKRDLIEWLDKTVKRPGNTDGNASTTYELKNFKVGIKRRWTGSEGGHPANGNKTTVWLVYATYVEAYHLRWKTEYDEHKVIYDAFKEDTGNWYFAVSDDPDQSERNWEGPSDL